MSSDRSVPVRGLHLLVPERTDRERAMVADAWERAGGRVARLGRFWEPPSLDRSSVRVYGPETFALVLAQKLDLRLVSPPDDLLALLDPGYLRREIRIATLAAAASLDYPAFVKPLVPKLFRAAVYQGAPELTAECRGLAPETRVLVSEVVDLVAEARAFLLRGTVRDLALYEGDAELVGARALADDLTRSQWLPETCVVDLGLTADRGWVIVEANACWGAGLNGCSTERVLPCIEAATRAY